MGPRHQLSCLKTRWQDREAFTLSNGLVELVSLTGGGHIAEFRFTEQSGLPALNPLWVPPWKTIEPFRYQAKAHAARYGTPDTGKLIGGIVGHNICLDYFGSPSEEEAAQGLSIHGEAPSAKWGKTRARLTPRQAGLTLSVHLPVAGLQFSREIRLRKGESVAYLKETVTNERKADHFFHWTQHVTLSPAFLAPKASRVAVSATRGLTYPHGYDEGKSMLPPSREFRWPYAPTTTGGKVDLTQPFSRPGRGMVATVLLDPKREIEFVAALNLPHRLMVGYCFRRVDYPWMTIWEENLARTASPWSGRTQSRGLEFGSTPMPVLRREAFARGPLFNTPTFSTVAARARATIQYVAFLAEVPPDFGTLRDISLAKNEILVQGSARKPLLHIPASGLATTGLV